VSRSLSLTRIVDDRSVTPECPRVTALLHRPAGACCLRSW